jgi:hypothetical protein
MFYATKVVHVREYAEDLRGNCSPSLMISLLLLSPSLGITKDIMSQGP